MQAPPGRRHRHSDYPIDCSGHADIKQTQRYLNITDEELRKAMTATHVPKISADPNQNRSVPWLEFTGRTMEQEVGTGWIEGVYPDDVQRCFDGFLPAFNARRPFMMEYRLRRADGEYRWVTESGIPRYTGAGEFAGYIGSNVDVTDLKRAVEDRERLGQLQADLAHINRVTTMGELAASIAHEIKQPISAARTNANTCLRWLGCDQPDVEEAREAVSRIIQCVTRASEIIGRIRSLFKKGEPKRE